MDKRQLQQMLREMGVPYPPDATEATLVEILKGENQKQWTKASKSRAVKIKKKSEPKHTEVQRTASKSIRRPPTAGTTFKRPIQRVDRKAASREMVPKDPSNPLGQPRKPAPVGGPQIFDAMTVEPEKAPEKSIPIEAAAICDLCDKPSGESGTELIAYSLADQAAYRNTVFLCPDCTSRVKAQGDGKDIRALKRKARKRANSNLQISYRKVKNAWGFKPGQK
jgi:hypothetical protein